MFRISCFADEISADLNEQIKVIKRNNLKYIELRSVWDKNVLDLTDDEVNLVKSKLSENGISVSCIGSPIGKVNIEDNFDKELDRFNRAVKVALVMKACYIRVFSFYLKKEEISKYKEKVLDRLKIMTEIATKNNIVLLHENEADIFGESSENCKVLLKSVDKNSFKAAFDPSNFVVAGEDTLNSFGKLKDYIEYMHIKDSKKSTGEIVIAGRGDGQVKSILNSLRHKEKMFLSLEPHLSIAGQYRGFTGPNLFEEDLNALKEILNELNIDFE